MIPAMMRIAALLALAVCAGCAPQMRNLPLGAGRSQVNAAVGGPLVDAFGTTIPVPYAVAGVTHGAGERVNLHADLHLTAAAFRFLGVTPGVTWYPDLPLGPWVAAFGADALLFSDFAEARLYPEVAVTVTHTRAGRWRPYAGFYNTLQFSKEPRYIISPYVGVSRSLGRWQPYVEMKWLAAGDDNRLTPVTYHGIGERGALATQFGLSLNVGGTR